jgi:hypothetical protein
MAALIGVWLWNPFIGLWICAVLPVISFSILIVSFIVEKIEISNVPNWYYYLMLVLIVSPVLVLLFFGALDGFGFLSTL